MKVFPIEQPLAGEAVLAVQPPLQGDGQAGWRQRLNYFTGRRLTHTDLRLEQRERSARLALLAQALTPGVVSGLEVAARPAGIDTRLELAAGLGLAASGEVVQVNRNRSVRLDDIRVYAPAALLDGEATEPTPPAAAYRLGDTLGQLRAQGVALPGSLILLLQPVAIEHVAQTELRDPCEIDPSDEAFENWQWLDGVRLVLYAWNPPVPWVTPPVPAWARNRAAYRVFEAERQLAAGTSLPWWTVGLPIALIGLDARQRFQFLDRHSVVRRGGEVRSATLPLRPLGDRLLWQARFDQFNEQLLDWLLDEPSLEPSQLKALDRFRLLPPVGVLPAVGFDRVEGDAGAIPHWQPRLTAFFPPSFSVTVRPVPYEQIDLAIAESAPLQGYDLYLPDQVELLVPVPQEQFEPELLEVAQIDPAFADAVEHFVATRNAWLGRRQVVRERAAALYRAIKGEPLAFPAVDPAAVDEAETPDLEFQQDLLRFDAGDDPRLGCRFLRGQSVAQDWFMPDFDDSQWSHCFAPRGTRRAAADTAADGQLTWLRYAFTLAGLEPGHRYTLAVRFPPGDGALRVYLNGHRLTLAASDAQGHYYELGELRGVLRPGRNVLAVAGLDSNRLDAVALLDTEDRYGTHEVDGKTRVREMEALRGDLAKMELSSDEVGELERRGLEDFIDFLQAKVDRSNDHIDFGFLRLRTDTYRVRQMMLGNDAATRLATSPALAEIAQGESALATKEELTDFFQRMKLTIGEQGEGKAKPAGGEGGGAPGAAPGHAPGSSVGGRSAAPGVDVRAVSFTGGGRPPFALGRGTRAFFAAEFIRPTAGAGQSLAGRLAPAGRPGKGLSGVAGLSVPVAMQAKLQLARAVSDGQLFASATEDEVLGQAPVIGALTPLRNVTVGERLKMGSAELSYWDGVAAKGETLQNLLATGLHLDDLEVPGLFKRDDKGQPTGERYTFGELNPQLIAEIAAGHFDAPPSDDETGFFNAGVKALEDVVGILRLVEGRVHAYRRAIKRCQQALQRIDTELSRADRRLKGIGDELAEARHDVTVARALMAEEQGRIEGINARRDKLLQGQVPFLLFRRPRRVAARVDVPVHALDPDLAEQPLPLCDLSGVQTPEALAAMLDVVRDAPLKWFRAARHLLPQLSRLADLQVTLAVAKRRASAGTSLHPLLQQGQLTRPNVAAATGQQARTGEDRLLQGVGATLHLASQRVQQARRATAQVDLSAFQHLGWAEAAQRLPGLVSLADLIDANHGRFEASRGAADVLARLAEVVTCLYRDFSAVPAVVRLTWAERLSQYDGPVDLRNLHALPRFGELGFIQRHDMQRLVDWLYDRVDPRYPEAGDLISDLVRAALLVASHAPVNQLIAAHLPAPVVLRPGGLLHLIADLGRVRIGMQVSLGRAGQTVALGRVTDMVGGEVVAEVISTARDGMQLDTDAQVQIGERLGGSSLAFGRGQGRAGHGR